MLATRAETASKTFPANGAGKGALLFHFALVYFGGVTTQNVRGFGSDLYWFAAGPGSSKRPRRRHESQITRLKDLGDFQGELALHRKEPGQASTDAPQAVSEVSRARFRRSEIVDHELHGKRRLLWRVDAHLSVGERIECSGREGCSGKSRAEGPRGLSLFSEEARRQPSCVRENMTRDHTKHYDLCNSPTPTASRRVTGLRHERSTRERDRVGAHCRGAETTAGGNAVARRNLSIVSRA